MQVLGYFSIPETIVIRGDRKSRLKSKTSYRLLRKGKTLLQYSSCPSISIAYDRSAAVTQFDQQQYKTCYQTCVLVRISSMLIIKHQPTDRTGIDSTICGTDIVSAGLALRALMNSRSLRSATYELCTQLRQADQYHHQCRYHAFSQTRVARIYP